MAIEKMKKLRLLAVRDSKEELLKELIRHGCVEFSEAEDALADSEARAAGKKGTVAGAPGPGVRIRSFDRPVHRQQRPIYCSSSGIGAKPTKRSGAGRYAGPCI